MKILVIGGTFDNNGGKRSGIVAKVAERLMELEGTVHVRNGGRYDDLAYDLEHAVKDSDIVFWWANVPNDLPKVRGVKESNPRTMLVSSKRNDGDKYPFGALVGRALAMKANLCFEFKKQDSGIFAIRVFDPLGSCWYEGTDINRATEAAYMRLKFLVSITRQSTIQSPVAKELPMAWYFDRFKQEMEQSDRSVDVPDEQKFVDTVKRYAEVFQSLMPDAQTTRMLGNASMKPVPPQVGRCGKGMPSFRKDGYVFVSRRNVDKQFLSLEDFVPAYLEDGKVFYCGDQKPSVDTPIQLRLYKELPNIRYMIHSHCYLEKAPFTKTCVPCGAIEEVGEILSVIDREYGSRKKTCYVLNLIGHGSIVMAEDPDMLDDLEYVARPMPEMMF